MATSFGQQHVALGAKQNMVDDVFHKVASRYDLMNDLMSGGMHRLWKSAMVAALAPPRTPVRPWHGLDVAGGTGDIAFRILDAGSKDNRTTVLDINSSMLEVGKIRAEQRNLGNRVNFIEGNAEALPFEGKSFDAYTIGFGIRNVPDIGAALNEAYRVLKFGGRFLCLEFSEVDIPVLETLYQRWSDHGIPLIGKIVTGDQEPYQYLVGSIRKFPNQQRFATMISDAGFSRVTWRNYAGGIAALHLAWKV